MTEGRTRKLGYMGREGKEGEDERSFIETFYKNDECMMKCRVRLCPRYKVRKQNTET